MDNQNEHINPWAEKLNELRAPGVGDSWPAMGVLLDAEMPVQPKKDDRRWILLLLLLLLIGVCHFPHTTQTGVKMIPGKDTATVPSFKTNTAEQASKRAGAGPEQYSGQNQVAEKEKAAEPEKISLSEKELSPQNKKKTVAAEIAIKDNSKKTRTKEDFALNPEIARDAKENSVSPGAAFADRAEIPGHKKAAKTNHTQHLYQQPDIAPADSPQPEAIPTLESDASRPDTATKNAEKPKAAGDKKNTSIPIPDTLKAGEKRTGPAAKNQVKKDSVEDARGWAFGLGLNQFFIVGDQEKSNFNSNGTNGTISDYIPVPAARYYFHKWFYLQAEAQINSPQYTKTLLAGQGVKAASLSGEAAVQSVFIKELFYFNIPVSIHYSPVKNLFVGAGLQYSRLTNGVALFQDTRLSSGFGPNVVRAGDSTLIVSKVGNFKKDSAYRQLRTNEWRFLLDLNYQWRRLTIGARYNQAFSNFIDIHLSYLNITQAQNRSLQLYLRYMVLDRRRKFLIPGN